ncbi:ATP:cob(I)alamin adenosyltransferase [Draconibacterium orientale]|jgi:ATP:cob(I)alamin adenosyltransferase|uniref:Corrinoid adenosyltransferase n=1 Tax=Draconibacterium orientale TaxID=1168034 RepID=X5DDV9_9BACT|nr:cob(I)yrinic acid a,c-diamide adenosyltransferase [Draconibacterium orientale]AHW58552.1 ATP:cob(I)alamin adenosyltransferase [Draconibacterium orientale]SET89426.1 ATP:cob(I)alamin adenosyltransferase [Draconibacterium orientale]
MAITTKTGDTGQTALFGGNRVGKSHIRIRCNGLIDEVNVRIGMLLAELPENHQWGKGLLRIQRDMMLMMSHIATPVDSPKPNNKPHAEKGLRACETWIEALNDFLKDEKLAFVLPGGNKVASLCHFVRTGIRTAERELVELNQVEQVADYILQYFNRMSDLFYLLAIVELKQNNVKVAKFRLFPSQKSKNEKQ